MESLGSQCHKKNPDGFHQDFASLVRYARGRVHTDLVMHYMRCYAMVFCAQLDFYMGYFSK